MLAPLILRKNTERRLRQGHLWVYSNEVDTSRSPLNQFEPGQNVEIQQSNGRFLGTAYINPHSLICARLISRDPQYVLDGSLIKHRLNIALSLRERLFEHPSYRLIYGESDNLPGLVVDRFNDVLAVQIGTAGMEQHKDTIVNVLAQLLKPRAIVLRNDSKVREQEGLETYTSVAFGELNEPVYLEENGCRFMVPVLEGQKTGWFYDHRMNRLRAAHYARGLRVLDIFSYIGGWGVQAAAAGAQEVLCLDSSERALGWLKENATLNHVEDRVSTLTGNAFDTLKQLREQNEKFDLVISDPPAFIKRRKDQKAGEQAYYQINQAALQVLKPDGILVSASCSLHLPSEHLLEHIHNAGRHLSRQVQVLEQGGQGPDHPIHPAIPETAYLKSVISRVLLA